MNWILNGDYTDFGTDRFDKPITLIKEDVIYDINKIHIFDSIKIYCDVIGAVDNLNEDQFNNIVFNTYTDNDYYDLTLHSKIIYLFEADCLVTNMDGRYIKWPNKNGELDLYMFFQAPPMIHEISNKIYDEKFFKGDDLLIHYFRRIGTIDDKEGLLFNLINMYY